MHQTVSGHAACARGPTGVPQQHTAIWRARVTRQIISSARRLFRLPAWAVAVAAAFVLGAVVGPMAASAGPASGSSRSAAPPGVAPLRHVFVIMMENTSYDDLLSPTNTNTAFIRQLAANNGLANNY